MSDNTFGSRLRKAWDAFRNKDPAVEYKDVGVGYSSRPDRVRLTRGNERSIITSVFTRIAIDVSEIDFRHCRLDKNRRYSEDIPSGLNECMNVEANLDQASKAYMQDLVLSLFDEGCVASVPIVTDRNPNMSSSFDIYELRTAKIVEWYPSHVKTRVYDQRTGRKSDVLVHKRNVAIIENPLYPIINEHNSTVQRLMRKLSLLDVTDEQTASGKLDLIIQLPYVIRNEARKDQAERRRKDIEMQLASSKYGIAYTDGTEHITQLNRSLENNLLKQVEYLTNLLFSQLGITQSILDGTADEQTLLNYYNRTIQPIVSAITQEYTRKFLTKTARSQNQAILAFRDPFKLVPINNLAEIADKFTRNEIITSNEIRQIVGLKPSADPKADELRNSNISQAKNPSEMPPEEMMEEAYADEQGEIQNE